MQRETLVGHIPRNISKFVSKFLQLPNLKVYCRVIGNRLNRGTGLEIPETYTLNGYVELTRYTLHVAHDKLLSRWNPKSTKIWKLMKIWKIDVWNKITYGKWNMYNYLSLSANEREVPLIKRSANSLSAIWRVWLAFCRGKWSFRWNGGVR